VTILEGVTRHALNALLSREMILARDLYPLSAEELSSLTGLDLQTVSRIKTQARNLCR
jgi:DNA-directed RNA polymerase specialized sigma24 family protein